MENNQGEDKAHPLVKGLFDSIITQNRMSKYMHRRMQQVEQQLESKDEEFLNEQKLIDFIQDVRNDEKVAIAAQKKVILSDEAMKSLEIENQEGVEEEDSGSKLESSVDQEKQLELNMQKQSSQNRRTLSSKSLSGKFGLKKRLKTAAPKSSTELVVESQPSVSKKSNAPLKKPDDDSEFLTRLADYQQYSKYQKI